MRTGPKEWRPAFADVVEVMTPDCLVVTAPEWFRRKDFQQWRKKSGVATWKSAEPEGQDVFLVLADGGLDWHAEGLPNDILAKLERLASDHETNYAVIWIKAG